MQFTKSRILVAVAIVTLAYTAQNASATTKLNLFKDAPVDNNTWFIGIGGGYSWIHLPNSTSVPNGSFQTPPYDQDLFSINNPKTSMEQLQIGYRWHTQKQFFPYTHVFFQVRQYNTTDIKGTVEQYSIPEFLNYNYKINYQATLATINGKFDLIQINRFLPYISAGIGFMNNYVSDYTESALPNVTQRISPDYSGNTKTQLAYTLGVGVDYIITKNIWATLGFDHVFKTKLSSGSGAGSWSGTSLNFGNAQINTVFLNITASVPDAFMS